MDDAGAKLETRNEPVYVDGRRPGSKVMIVVVYTKNFTVSSPGKKSFNELFIRHEQRRRSQR